MFNIFKVINNCLEHAHLNSELETIDNGSLLDVLELKLELIEASIDENKCSVGHDDLDYKSTVILLRDHISKLQELKHYRPVPHDAIEDCKIEISRLITELI